MRKWLVRRHSGQSMVEFAILAPVFFLLLLGTIDLGRGIYIYNSISDAAREGTRAAIPFDSPLPTNNLVTYSITSRLFAKKPPKPARPAGAPPVLTGSFASLVLGEEAPTHNQELVPPSPALTAPPVPQAPGGAGEATPGSGAGEGAAPATPHGGETYVPSEVSTGASSRTPLSGPLVEPLHVANVGPVEIASFELAQGYSLDSVRPLSRSAALDANSLFGPVIATVRFNPTYSASLDLRTSYDILFHDIDKVSVSGGLKTLKSSYVRLSWVLDRDLEGVQAGITPACPLDGGRVVGRQGPNELRCFANSSQIHVVGGTALLGRKITADVEGSYDIENSFLRDQRYRVGYNTQCCGVLFEVAKRALPAGSIPSSDIQYRFVLNLRGVGTFLDLNGRQQ